MIVISGGLPGRVWILFSVEVAMAGEMVITSNSWTNSGIQFTASLQLPLAYICHRR